MWYITLFRLFWEVEKGGLAWAWIKGNFMSHWAQLLYDEPMPGKRAGGGSFFILSHLGLGWMAH
jgi:hypothetical protein